MAIDKLMNQTQGEDIISKLGNIATTLENVTTVEPAKFGMGYAVCNTAAGTAAKTANIANYTLTEGALVTVKFTNANTASNATLNLNNTGAKPLLYKGSALTTDIISAGDICTFIYSTANSGSYNIINVDALSGAGAGTVKSVGAEGGIITDQTSGAAISTTGSVKLNLKSNTAYTGTVADPATTNKVYPVALDGDGHPCVGVPWTDTTYTQASNSAITVNNTDHTIDVAVGAVGTKGVVELSTSIPSTGAVDTKVATEKAVADSISDKVAGPIASLAGAIATYDDTTGKVLANSGFTIEETELTGSSVDIPTSYVVEEAIMATAGTLSDRISDKLDADANAVSAAKLNNGTSDYEVGSATKGVYFDDGIPKAMTCSVETNVPQNAVFTDTTYSNGTGITIGSGNAINHSNSVTAVTTAGAYKVKYDAQGHITGTAALAASDVGAAASDHVHGNITNAGALQTTDVGIATGDKIVVTDASNSNKVARTSAAFDTTITTKCLTQAGTFADFNNYSHPTTAGNKHIPTSGATGNYLKYGESSGTASWAAPLTSWPATPTNTDTLPSTKLIADRFTTNESNILYNLNMGVKNILPVAFESKTTYGVTCTNNGDGSITVNGTNSQSSGTIVIANVQSTIVAGYDDPRNFLGKNKNYVCIGNTTTANLRIQILGWNSSSDNSIIASSTTDAVSFNTGNWNYISVRIWVQASATFNNIVIKPMICTDAAWAQSHDYMPPALPNYDLTRLQSEDRAELVELVDNGAKNLYNPDDLRGVPTGLTVTRESDGTTLKINGTYTGSDYAYIFVGHFTGTNTGTYYLASTNTKTMIANAYYVYTDDNHMTLGGADDNDVTSYNYTSAPNNIKVVIRVSPNTSFNNDTVKILICTKAAFGVSQKFVPYRPNYDLVCKSMYSYVSEYRIRSNADLNNYTAPNSYTCITNEEAATLSHCPTTYAFRLETRQITNTERYVQIIYSMDGIYYRHYVSAGWTSWYKVNGTVVS